jgi:T-complex protein 1 subunit delta
MLKDMSVMHPAARMLVDLSSAQDVEAGDGTTSVVVIAGSLLGAAEKLLSKGLHPTVISESFQRAAGAAVEILHNMSRPINLSDRSTLLQAASTSLSSKIVSQHSGLLGPMAVDSVLKVCDPKTAENVDLRDIRIVKKVGGTIEDSEMVDGVVLNQPVIKSSGGPTRIEKARIGLIQFQLSPPKPDVSLLASSCYWNKTDTRILDGEPNRGERLPPDGQDPERGAPIHAQHGQEDPEDQV